MPSSRCCQSPRAIVGWVSRVLVCCIGPRPRAAGAGAAPVVGATASRDILVRRGGMPTGYGPFRRGPGVGGRPPMGPGDDGREVGGTTEGTRRAPLPVHAAGH